MWVLFLFAATHNSGTMAVTSHEFQSRDQCVIAVNELKKRPYVADAYCVKK